MKNKKIKMISNILFIVFMTIMTLLIFITGQSRFTGREPSLFGYRMYVVESGSMLPTLDIDSIIIVREYTSKKIKKDDIVTYYAGNENIRVTHRVVKVVEKGSQFITQGDANNTEDPNILKGDRIIGKVVLSIPYVGKIFRVTSSRVGISLLITIGFMYFVFPILIKKFK